MQLQATELIPGSHALPGSLWLGNLCQSKQLLIEVFGRRLQICRNGYIDVTHSNNSDSHKRSPTIRGYLSYCSSLKFGFSITPKILPKGSLTDATLISPPTS